MEINYIAEGLKFMLLGMTTVFLFLLLLIFILKLQEKIFKKYFPQDKEKSMISTPVVAKSGTSDDSQIIVAITAAITDFKKK